MNKPINRRLEHIQLLHQILFNQKKGVPRNIRKGFERLIHILTYTTNIEFSVTYRSFEIKDKVRKFNELNDIYLFANQFATRVQPPFLGRRGAILSRPGAILLQQSGDRGPWGGGVTQS